MPACPEAYVPHRLRGRAQAGLAEKPIAEAPVVIVHSLSHATAALHAAVDAGRPIVLASAPDAGIYGGATWFAGLVAQAAHAVPAATFTASIDCGNDAGAAHAAITAGISRVVFVGGASAAARLTALADRSGIALETTRLPATIDLASEFFADDGTLRRTCREVLASPPTIF